MRRRARATRARRRPAAEREPTRPPEPTPSPNFGYSVDWNPDDWTVAEDLEDAAGRDLLELQTNDANSDGQVSGILFVEGGDEWSTTDDCVAQLGTEFGQFDPDTADPVEDENGDPFAISEDDRSLAAYINTATDTDTILLTECRAVPDSDVIVAFSYVTAVSDTFVEDVYPGIQDIADTLSAAGTDASASPSDEEASPSRRASQSPEASPSDESTPVAGGGDADASAGTYTSPTFGYSLEWNPDDWEVVQEIPDSGGRDRLDLTGAGNPYVLYIEGSEEWSDPDDCVSSLSGEVRDFDPDTADPVEDENGDPFTVSDDDRALAAYVDSTDRGDAVYLFECRADPDSDVIVAFTFLSGNTDTFVEDVYPDLADLADSLTFAGGSGGATPEASPSRRSSRSPEASPSDEASPSRRSSPSAGASASDEGDATPEASADPSAELGVNGSTYVSPTYLYFLSWDEDVWTVDDESSEDEVDALTLSSDLLTLNVTGYHGNDNDTATCVDNLVSVIDDRGDGNATVLTGDDGDPVGQSDDTDTTAQRAISYTADGTQFGSLVTCVALSDGNILAIEFTAVPDDLLSDDANTQINDILGNLVYF